MSYNMPVTFHSGIAKHMEIDFNEAVDMMQKLIDAGYVVAMWTPEEVAGVDNLRRLTDRIIELGNDTIQDFQAMGGWNHVAN